MEDPACKDQKQSIYSSSQIAWLKLWPNLFASPLEIALVVASRFHWDVQILLLLIWLIIFYFDGEQESTKRGPIIIDPGGQALDSSFLPFHLLL